MGPAVLFVTRKWPPAIGGMETFSQQLYEQYAGAKQVVALRRGQRWLPLFMVQSVIAASSQGHRVDVIHLGDAMLAPLAPALRRIAGKPVVVTAHGQEFIRDLPGYRAALAYGMASVRPATVAVSTFSAARFADVFGWQPRVISNGIAPPAKLTLGRCAALENRLRLGLPASGPLLVSIGRLVPRKGVAWFIQRVMPVLGDVTLAVAGDGPEAETVRRLARTDRRIHVLGYRTADEVGALRAAGGIFIVPNIPSPATPEGYGIAPAEAAASGMPVIVANVEGLPDMAADFGLRTVSAGDPSVWAAAVRSAIENPEAWRATRPPRTWTDVASDYAAFFEESIRAAREKKRASKIHPA
jgi:phosphatidyl-myo-inositol dimannoside synthase